MFLRQEILISIDEKSASESQKGVLLVKQWGAESRRGWEVWMRLLRSDAQLDWNLNWAHFFKWRSQLVAHTASVF